MKFIARDLFAAFDQRIFDGALHALAALARGTAGVLGRLQTGSLHFYAFLVLGGLAGALWWSLRNA